MYYEKKDLATLAGAIGVPDEDRQLIRPDALCREIPGAAPWIVRHPWIPALLMVPGVVYGAW